MAALFRDGRLVTTAAVAVRAGRYFLARRKSEGAQSLRWEFPGGKCDDDGDERRCLEREFAEEFGVTVSVAEELGSVPFEHAGTRYMLVGYRVEIPPVPLELREHVEAGWFLPGEVLQLDLADSDRSLVQHILPACPDQ
ncbi:MAG: NUDIX domain-containing protein [Spirochaetaceae bacterium]|nr:MAG: NUDIX domain-containing protein [Spirochaetaceae bacterium]